MSTLIVEVDSEQEKVLETLLTYMDVSFQKVTSPNVLWESLSNDAQNRIQKGLADAEEGRHLPAQTVLEQLRTL